MTHLHAQKNLATVHRLVFWSLLLWWVSKGLSLWHGHIINERESLNVESQYLAQATELSDFSAIFALSPSRRRAKPWWRK